jgi:hypothetical protein
LHIYKQISTNIRDNLGYTSQFVSVLGFQTGIFKLFLIFEDVFFFSGIAFRNFLLNSKIAKIKTPQIIIHLHYHYNTHHQRVKKMYIYRVLVNMVSINMLLVPDNFDQEDSLEEIDSLQDLIIVPLFYATPTIFGMLKTQLRYCFDLLSTIFLCDIISLVRQLCWSLWDYL